MSKNINLVKYAIDDKEKLYETECELIESAFLSLDLYDQIVTTSPLVDKKIFENIDTEDQYYLIECFDDDKIKNIISELEELFIKILETENNIIFGQDEVENTSTKLSTPSTHVIQPKELEASINRFRTITNVINIFNLKNNQYSKDASVVLKLG